MITLNKTDGFIDFIYPSCLEKQEKNKNTILSSW